MLKKVYTERGFLYNPIVQVVFSVKMSNWPNIENMKNAIYFAINHHEAMRCRIMQDVDGQAFFVLRENKCEPSVEVRDYHLSEQEFINEQEKIPFDIEKGELIRFIVELVKDGCYLRVVCNHMAGDGKSILILIDEIMTNLHKIDDGTFECSYDDDSIIPLLVHDKKQLESELQISELLKNSMDEYNKKWEEEKVVFNRKQYQQMFEKFWSKNATKVKSIAIHKDTLAELVHISREKNITINSILVTAIAKAFTEQKKMTVIVDTRPADYRGMGNFAGSLMLESMYDDNKTFWENAEYIHNQIHARIDSRVMTLFALGFMGLLDENFQDAKNFLEADCYESELVKAYNNLYGSGKGNLPVVISNLGVNNLASSYGKYKIEEVSFVSPKTNGIECNVGVITANDIMKITVEYGEKATMDYDAVFDDVVQQLEEISLGSIEYLSEQYA